MKASTKIWLIAAAALILVGALILCCVMIETKGEFMKLNTDNYETNHYAVEEEFSGIKTITDTADIEFVLSDDGKVKVTCYEKSKIRHSVSVKDGVLMIEAVDTRKWYDHIQLWGFENSKITVYLPEGEYGDLTVKASTGDVKMPKALCFETMDISLSTGDVESHSSSLGTMKIQTKTGDISVSGVKAGAMEISVSTGDITVKGAECADGFAVKVSTGKTRLSDVTCTDLTSQGGTGDLTMENTVAAGAFEIKRTTGSVRFEACDAAEITVTTGTGDVKGSLASEKIFITKSKSGDIHVPETTSGGKCKVTTNTGDIIIDIAK
jgi:DUF4097 and DUF4098 domain-containing protein YvlB